MFFCIHTYHYISITDCCLTIAQIPPPGYIGSSQPQLYCVIVYDLHWACHSCILFAVRLSTVTLELVLRLFLVWKRDWSLRTILKALSNCEESAELDL